MDTPYGPRLFLTADQTAVKALDQNGQIYCGGLLDANISEEERSFSELIAEERERIRAVKQATTAFILTTGCRSLKIARAVVFAARKEDVPLVLCMESDEDGRTPADGSVAACLIVLQELGIQAFGISGKLTPQQTAAVCELLTPFAKIPLLVSPTAGQPNPILPDLYDLAPAKMADLLPPILDCGVTMILANAGVTEQHIAALRETLFTYDSSHVQPDREDEEDQIILANETNFFVISDERLELAPQISCTQDMSDAFLAAEEDSFDVLQILVSTADDALVFSKNEHLAGLPVMFCSDDEIALKAALLLYNGRAMIDRESAIEETTLEEIAKKYGCVLY